MKHLTREKLNLFVDGQLGGGEASDVREHLSGCSGCSRLHSDLISLRTRLQSVPPPDLPASFAQTVLDRTRSEAGQEQEWTIIEKTAEKVLAGLTFAALVLWALSSGMNGISDRQAERSAGLLDVYIRDSSTVKLMSGETLTRDDLLAAALMQE